MFQVAFGTPPRVGNADDNVAFLSASRWHEPRRAGVRSGRWKKIRKTFGVGPLRRKPVQCNREIGSCLSSEMRFRRSLIEVPSGRSVAIDIGLAPDELAGEARQDHICTCLMR